MKLYKYRSLENYQRLFEILENGNLYCCNYKDLNDPFEGYATHISGGFHFPIAMPMDIKPLEFKIKELNEIYNKEKLKICSLSANYKDVKMWSFYADSHKGISIEIEIPDNEIINDDLAELNKVYKVQYEETIKEITVDEISREAAFRILRRKTNAWKYENEYRVITENNEYNVNGKITRILLGIRLSDINRKILKKLFPAIQMVNTELNPGLSEIEIV
jgi:Protein of unknown function (DUF2971)